MHFVSKEIYGHQTVVDESIIVAHSEKIVKSYSKLNGQRTYDMKKNLVGVSCLVFKAISYGREAFHQ